MSIYLVFINSKPLSSNSSGNPGPSDNPGSSGNDGPSTRGPSTSGPNRQYNNDPSGTSDSSANTGPTLDSKEDVRYLCDKMRLRSK